MGGPRAQKSWGFFNLMKILILSPLYYPDRFGGIEKVVYEITRRLAKKNIDVTVVCGTLNSVETSIHEGVTVRRISSVGAFNESSFEKYYEANNKALDIIKQEKPDLIWAHDWFFALAALNYAETKPITLISQAHILKRFESKDRISSWRSFVDLMQTLLFRNSEMVLAVSPSQIRSLHQHYRIPKNKIQHMHYGLDSAGLRINRTVSNKPPTFLYLGRFEAEKNIETFLESLAIYERELPRSICVRLMGSGSLQERLKEKASRLTKVHIEFLPFSSDFTIVQDTISAADALILPSLYDSYGLAALEALSLEVPILVSQQCGISEDLYFYPEQMIFDGYDKREMYEAVQYCLQHLTHLPSIGLNARKNFISTHSWDLSLERILERIKYNKKEGLYA